MEKYFFQVHGIPGVYCLGNCKDKEGKGKVMETG